MCKLLGIGHALGVRHILGHLWGPLREKPALSKQTRVSVTTQPRPSELRRLSAPPHCGNVYSKEGAVPPRVFLLMYVCVIQAIDIQHMLVWPREQRDRNGSFMELWEESQDKKAFEKEAHALEESLHCSLHCCCKCWKAQGGFSPATNIQTWWTLLYSLLCSFQLFSISAHNSLIVLTKVLSGVEIQNEQDRTGCRDSEGWTFKQIMDGLALAWLSVVITPFTLEQRYMLSFILVVCKVHSHKQILPS